MTSLKDAATVVVLRPDTDCFELYMLRRHGGHDFMPDVWVFPGGGVEPRDRKVDRTGLSDGFDTERARRRLDEDLDGPTAVGLHVAAIRETFEEAGLLLARKTGGDPAVDDEPDAPWLEQLRKHVDDGDRPLTELAADHDLVVDVDRLVYFAHWITPHFEDHRFDTRFFAAPAPPNQTADPGTRESTGGRWWSPRAALGAYRDEDIELAPPTVRILEELSEFESVDGLLDQLRDRPAPPIILPTVDTEADEPILLLPGDPDYPDDDPRLTAATPVRDGVTRMVRRDGQWWSVEDEE